MKGSEVQKEQGSFRDSCGYVYYKNDKVYRRVNENYQPIYRAFMGSGLYDALQKKSFLISHNEVFAKSELNLLDSSLVISPMKIPFVSYPYEWPFSALKDAALLTLDILEECIKFGYVLKDASAYNVQFFHGKPVFIDTLSFEPIKEGEPWIAYKQFCQHFLAPLALMVFSDDRLSFLQKHYLDGIPLDLASKLLPVSSWGKFSLLTHIHLHAKSFKHYANRSVESSGRDKKFSKHALLALCDSLKSAVKGLKYQEPKTEWGDYYNNTNYSNEAFKHKECIVQSILEQTCPKTMWDLGANEGVFSYLAAKKGIFTLSFDLDSVAVEKNYQKMKHEEQKNILPLILDITNPSPSLGWHNEERTSIGKRGEADLVLALGLVHHLVITQNIPFSMIAKYFSSISSSWLVVEFIPTCDSQCQILLRNKQKSNHRYDEQAFEEGFEEYFKVEQKTPVKESKRFLYLMRKK